MKQKTQETGTRQLVWLPNNLFVLTEIVRRKIGMSRSGFYRYAITQLLQDLSVLSARAKDELKKAVEQSKVNRDEGSPEQMIIKAFSEADDNDELLR